MDSKCRSEQELNDFVTGRLTAHLLDEVVGHIELCVDCQSTVVMLSDNSDTFVNAFREPLPQDPLEREAACRDGVAQMGELPATNGAVTDHAAPWEVEQIGPYAIVGQLGVGGMGTVFEAVHSKLKRAVALKILPASRWVNAAAIARFEREMEVIGQLDHPNIVRASDAGEENGMHYLVMEHVDGLDLSRIVSRLGPLSVADACEIARQAAIGLQYAHESHLVHRDIKPSNLMLQRRKPASGEQGEHEVLVKILDLGLALLGEEHTTYKDELTTVGQLMGTLDYMSPEQGTDSHDVDTRSDIYSLGATLYKLLVGAAPFSGPEYDTLIKKVSALANKPSPSIRDERPELPGELTLLVDRMLAKSPAERFANPREVVEALTPFAEGADLPGLLQRAMNVESEIEMPPNLPARGIRTRPSKQDNVSERRRRSGRWPIWAALVSCLLIGGVITAAVVIHIATDRGELVVRAEAGEGEIAIRRDGKSVKELQVHKGANAVSVRSGDYVIELKGASDGLTLSQQAVSIRRGEKVVVTIEQRQRSVADASGSLPRPHTGQVTSDPRGFNPAKAEEMMGVEVEVRSGAERPGGPAYWGGLIRRDAKSEPTYDGQTYSQWLLKLETERKPEMLTEAVRAFEALGEEDTKLAAESSAAILRIMRRYGGRVIEGGPRGTLVEKSREVLSQMPPDVVLRSLTNEVEQGQARSRAFVNYFLNAAIYSTGMAEFKWALKRDGQKLIQLLVDLPAQEVPAVRADALAFVVSNAKRNGIELAEIDGLLPRLRDGLRSTDVRMLSVATANIFKLEPENELLVPALVRTIDPKNPYDAFSNSVKSIERLGQLGPRAEPAVDVLVEVLQSLMDGSRKFGFGGQGMMGGGGFGGIGGRQDVNYLTIEALSRIGTGAERALPVLKELLALAKQGHVLPNGLSMVAYQEITPYAIARIEGRETGDPPSRPVAGAGGLGTGGGF